MVVQTTIVIENVTNDIITDLYDVPVYVAVEVIIAPYMGRR
jgi:hypothetical protein